MPAVTSLSPVKFDSAGTPNDRLTVTFLNANRSSGTVYYKSTPDVSSTSNDGSLTPGQSLTLDRASAYFIAAQDASGNPASAQVTAAPPVEQALVGDLFRLNPTTGIPQFSANHGTTWTDIVSGVLAGGYVPDGSQIPNIGGPWTFGISTGGLYADSGGGNLFQVMSFAYNTGTRATVAVTGFGKGNHVWGGNLIGYTSGVQDGDTSIGLEINAGILGNPNSGIATSLVLANKGGRTADGLPNAGPYIQMQASTNAETKYGIRTHISGGVQAVDTTGTLWLNDGAQTHILGLDWSGTTFTEAALKLGPGGHLKFDTVTGNKVGTSTAQKMAFWGSTPVVRQALTYSRATAGETAAGAALRSLLATIGLITDSTTA